jgi:hypothetical protein
MAGSKPPIIRHRGSSSRPRGLEPRGERISRLMHRGAINVSVCPRWRQRSAADIVSHNFSSEFNTDVLHHVILRCGATGLDVCRSVRAVLAGEVSRRYTLLSWWCMTVPRGGRSGMPEIDTGHHGREGRQIERPSSATAAARRGGARKVRPNGHLATGGDAEWRCTGAHVFACRRAEI